MAVTSRIRTALDEGVLTLPVGKASVVRPVEAFDMSVLRDHDTTVVETFFPDHDRWKTAGYAVSTDPVEADVTIISVPRSKEHARALVADAAQRSNMVVVDGAKTDGIDSIFKACRKILGPLPSVSKGHGRIFWFQGTDALSDWLSGGRKIGPDGFYTAPGVFSDRSVDQGSKLLADALPDTLPTRVADFGAGWGYLASRIIKKEGVETLDLIEAEALALDCAELNVKDPRAAFHWADATTFKSSTAYGAIIMNPPFHVGRDGDPRLGQDFIRSAAHNLTANGTLWMVANRHLPYEQTLSDSFRQVTPLATTGGFKLFKASRPTL